MRKQTQFDMKDGIVIDYVMLMKGDLDTAKLAAVTVTVETFFSSKHV